MPSSVSACPSGSASASGSALSALSVYAFLVSFAFTSHYNCKQLKSIYANFQDMQTANGQPHRNRNHATPSWAPAPNCLLPAACSRAPYASSYIWSLLGRTALPTPHSGHIAEKRERERESSITFVNYVGYVNMNYDFRYDTNCKIIVPIEYTQRSYK